MSLSKRASVFVVSVILSAGLLFSLFSLVNAKTLEEIQNEIEQYRTEISRLENQANTLKNQIAQFNAQINLTSLKIFETEERISLLGGRIDQLEGSLSALSDAFSTRVAETYKMRRLDDPLVFLLTSQDLTQAVTRFHYLKRIQEADREFLVRLQKAQDIYVDEKVDQEDLAEELEGQKQVLGAQKTAKADLLTVTKNDEKKYQQLLSQARAEYEAIVAITAGRGIEEEIGHVDEGVRIASIIQGSSCNSSGTHLHFIVSDNSTTHNPFNYLKPVDYQNCSGPGECSPGDPFNPSGGWNWPISPTIRFTQGYGSTWAVQNTWVGGIYSFHNGIDINSGDSTIKAVKSGTLYRGSYGTCRLRYVRVAHDDSSLDTFYLHVNY